MKQALGFLAMIVILLCLATAPALGQMYEWIDEKGVKHFSNDTPPPGARIIEKQEELPFDEETDRARAAEDRQTERELEESRRRRRQEVDARARQESERIQAEEAAAEAERARIEAEKAAQREQRYLKGTGEQKRRRRERAAQNQP